MMDNTTLYIYGGETRDGVVKGSMVAFIADSVNPGLVSVRDVATQKMATLPRKDLKQTKILNDSMSEAEGLSTTLAGLKSAVDGARPVLMMYLDEGGKMNSAMYAQDDLGRMDLIHGQMFYAHQAARHWEAQDTLKESAGSVAHAMLLTSRLVSTMRDKLSQQTEASAMKLVKQ